MSRRASRHLNEESRTIDLLWTGGWDSTFRLLQLLWTTETVVRPHYLVDEDRPSVTREIRAMVEIREGVNDVLEDGAERLLPTQYASYLATEVGPRYRQARRDLELAPQHEVLASYAEELGLDGLELCVERQAGPDAPGRLLPVLEPSLVVRDTPAGPVRMLGDGIEGPAMLFEHFAFPLLGYTKPEMEREAEERGYLPLLERSWTCHDPVLGLPCGTCRPCRTAVKEGLPRRVGRLGPLLHRVRWRLRE